MNLFGISLFLFTSITFLIVSCGAESECEIAGITLRLIFIYVTFSL